MKGSSHYGWSLSFAPKFRRPPHTECDGQNKWFSLTLHSEKVYALAIKRGFLNARQQQEEEA
jgi:hypothetical protein